MIRSKQREATKKERKKSKIPTKSKNYVGSLVDGKEENEDDDDVDKDVFPLATDS
jgi:hypothetical protein